MSLMKWFAANRFIVTRAGGGEDLQAKIDVGRPTERSMAEKSPTGLRAERQYARPGQGCVSKPAQHPARERIGVPVGLDRRQLRCCHVGRGGPRYITGLALFTAEINNNTNLEETDVGFVRASLGCLTPPRRGGGLADIGCCASAHWRAWGRMSPHLMQIVGACSTRRRSLLRSFLAARWRCAARQHVSLARRCKSAGCN